MRAATLTCDYCHVGRYPEEIEQGYLGKGLQICKGCKKEYEFAERQRDVKAARVEAEQKADEAEAALARNCRINLDKLATYDPMDAEIVKIEKQLIAGRRKKNGV